jgi:hypothetical protein
MRMKPIDKAILGMVSESPGRNASEPTGGLEKELAPEAEPSRSGRRQHGGSRANGCCCVKIVRELPGCSHESQLSHAELQCRTVQAKAQGCSVWSPDDPAGIFKNGQDMLPLGFQKGIFLSCIVIRQTVLQVRQRHLKYRPSGEYYRAFDNVLKFANIPWPLVFAQRLHRFGGNSVNGFFHTA